MKAMPQNRRQSTKQGSPKRNNNNEQAGDSEVTSPQPYANSAHLPIASIPITDPTPAPVQMEGDASEKEGWKRERALAANNATFGEIRPSQMKSMNWGQDKIRSWPAVRMAPKTGSTTGEHKLIQDRIALLDQINSRKKPEDE